MVSPWPRYTRVTQIFVSELEVLQYPLEYKTETLGEMSAVSSFYSPPYPDNQYQDIKPYCGSNMMFPFFSPGLTSLNAPKLVSN